MAANVGGKIPQDEGLPRNYYEKTQLRNYQFYVFRRIGTPPRAWTDEAIKRARPQWIQMAVPRPARPAIFARDRAPWAPTPYRNPSAVASGMPDLDDPSFGRDPWVNQAKFMVANSKEYFNSATFQYQKVLGYGGLGLALHYRYNGDQEPKDVAMKLSLKSWEADDLRQEERAMTKLAGAVHTVQLIEPHEVGAPPLAPYYPYPNGDDSSSPGESSGDESIDRPIRPIRGSRRDRTPAERYRRAMNLERRRAEWSWMINQAGPRKDFLLLEYLEGGDLRMLISKIASTAGPEGIARIPNRVLWALWLCLVRACVGMKYPPRKFHPERFDRRDLIENAPPARKRWRAKNMVHFDIDPTNIFVGNLERPAGFVEESEESAQETPTPNPDEVAEDEDGDTAEVQAPLQAMMTYFSGLVQRWTSSGPANTRRREPEPRKRKYDVYQRDRQGNEHIFVPKLKLGDFGLAEEIKNYKRNDYYVRRRASGKTWFYAPEQFGPEWEQIPANPDGPEAGEDLVAGNYGSPMNVWAIALTMWVLITQSTPPLPPQPQIPPGVNIPQGVDINVALRQAHPDLPISYCPLLMDGGFDYIDVDLRTAIYECMYHQPTYRPTVEQLLLQAQEGIGRRYAQESDEEVNDWVKTFMLSAPIH
ncbi:hypothetical protein K445DRAFT_305999 [Daldinia sp. EC12]|nr:hypothetical protein K445DRAFT_305999 [Daldinia sp. EC12]